MYLHGFPPVFVFDDAWAPSQAKIQAIQADCKANSGLCRRCKTCRNPLVLHFGLQTSQLTSLHGLHPSCKEDEVLRKSQFIEKTYLPYGNPEIV